MTAKTHHVCRDEHGVNLRSASYTANALSQYSSRSNPASVDIIGLAGVGSSVTVNSMAGAYRHGQYFQKNLSVTNNMYPAITVSAGTNSVSGSLYVPHPLRVIRMTTMGTCFPMAAGVISGMRRIG